MKKLLLMLVLLLQGCEVSQDDAERVLGAEGLHRVTLNGPAPFSCSDDDNFSSHFVAYRTVLDEGGNPDEVRVEGVVCCGWLKSCTVRF